MLELVYVKNLNKYEAISVDGKYPNACHIFWIHQTKIRNIYSD